MLNEKSEAPVISDCSKLLKRNETRNGPRLSSKLKQHRAWSSWPSDRSLKVFGFFRRSLSDRPGEVIGADSVRR